MVPMRWMRIRAHYAALHAQAQAAGVTQKAIAERGGIAGQNSVSRLLSNDHLGPSVEIFVRAVIGLGKSVSQFFLEVEQGAAGTLEPSRGVVDASALERLARIEHALEALCASLSSLTASMSPPGTRAGSVSHGGATVSNGDLTHHKEIETITQQFVEALANASAEVIRAQRKAQIAKGGVRDESLPTGPAPARTEHLNQLQQKRSAS